MGQIVAGGAGGCRRTGAVGKAASVVALHCLLDERLVGLVVHLGLRRRRAERSIEAIMLRLRLVQAEVVDSTHLVVWIINLPSAMKRWKQRAS